MKLLLAFAALLSLAGCGQPTRSPMTASDTLERGRAVYNFRCYFCHGYSGDARTVASEYLMPTPRDFTRADPATLSVETIVHAIRHGRPGTAMKAFDQVIPERDIKAVAAFVHDAFVTRKARNTQYHTAENGWPNHERYASAFPFARGELTLDTPAENLSDESRSGLKLFMGACVSCHDQGRKTEESARWELRAVSYPPNASSCLNCHNREALSPSAATPPAALSPTYTGRSRPRDAADPHEIHDRAPQIADLSAFERQGEHLYQANCAFCHAADGTGRNWIGSFIEPRPANFTDPAFHRRMPAEQMRRAIREGVTGTPMPAWQAVLAPTQIDAIMAYIERAFRPAQSAAQSPPRASREERRWAR